MACGFEKELEEFKKELSNTKDVKKRVTVTISEYEYKILKYFEISIKNMITGTVNQLEFDFLMTEEEKNRCLDIFVDKDEDEE